MTVRIHGPQAIDSLRRAGRAAARTLDEVGQRLRAGVATAQVDEWVRRSTLAAGAQPSQLGYHGFPAAVCTSRNEVVCHGIPSEREHLALGDIINVDVTSQLDGYHGDTSRTFAIGPVGPDARHLIETTQRCLRAAIDCVRPGARLGDLGHAIEALARSEGCSVVRDYGGHGIGTAMHEPPHVAHFGQPGRGLRLRPGMAFTIEPMLNLGAPEVCLLADGWTVVTVDGSLSAQFEHTVLVTARGVEILTAAP